MTRPPQLQSRELSGTHAPSVIWAILLLIASSHRLVDSRSLALLNMHTLRLISNVVPLQRLLASCCNPTCKISTVLGGVGHQRPLSFGCRDTGGATSVPEPRKGAQKFSFQAEVSRLMDIIIHSLYSNKVRLAGGTQHRVSAYSSDAEPVVAMPWLHQASMSCSRMDCLRCPAAGALKLSAPFQTEGTSCACSERTNVSVNVPTAVTGFQSGRSPVRACAVSWAAVHAALLRPFPHAQHALPG